MNASSTEWIGVDIGNSGIKLAWLSLAADTMGEIARLDWRFHADSHSAIAYAPNDPAWLSALTHWLETFCDPTQSRSVEWVISSVRRDALQLLLEFVEQRPSYRARVLSYRDLLPGSTAATASPDELSLELQVHAPERVGVDRLLAGLAAARWHVERPLIVIQAGSAVTVDLISGEAGGGEASKTAVFEGGAILPGIPMILRLVGQAADLLPEIEAGDISQLPELPGKDTEQAMRVGAVSSLIGGVLHVVSRYRQKYGESTPVIISGGDRLRLSTHVPEPKASEPELVMSGLRLVARRLSMNHSARM